MSRTDKIIISSLISPDRANFIWRWMCFAYEQACIHHIHAQKADVPGEKRWSFILLDVINLVVCRCRSQLESGEERNIAPPLRLLHVPSNLYVSSLVAVLLIYLFAYLLQQLLNQSSPSPAATLVCAALWYLLLKLALCSFWSHFLVSQTKQWGVGRAHTCLRMERVRNVSGRN